MSCVSVNKLPGPPAGKAGWPWTEESQRLPDAMADGRPWPRVSIVTPSYNQGQFIEETMRSVLLQGYPNLEYIIMDGGSTDGTVEVIRKYEDYLTYWVSEPDKGQANAINKGFERATGDIFAWINSDDYFYPGVLAAVTQAFLNHPQIALVYGYEDDVDTAGQLVQKVFPKWKDARTVTLYFGHPLPQLACFWRSEAHHAVGGLDEDLHYLLDYDFLLRLAYRYPSMYIDLCVGAFRRYPAQKTEMTTRVVSEQYRILERFVRQIEIPHWKRLVLQFWHRALLRWRYNKGFRRTKTLARRLHKAATWR